jgi:hypothetical protein
MRVTDLVGTEWRMAYCGKISCFFENSAPIMTILIYSLPYRNNISVEYENNLTLKK